MGDDEVIRVKGEGEADFVALSRAIEMIEKETEMKRYRVSAECLTIHEAIVEAENSEDAVTAYQGGEWVEDCGYSEPCNESDVVISVEEEND